MLTAKLVSIVVNVAYCVYLVSKALQHLKF